MSFDVIVAGIGAVGSAAAFHLARSGRRVLGLERYEIPNKMGSSHGETRTIRLAQYEDPAYVPFVRRAFELWSELESTSGQRLMFQMPVLCAGLPGTQVFEGARRSCLEHGIPHEVLTSREISARFPGLRFPEESYGVLEHEGGFLLPELGILAHARAAERLGAVFQQHEPLIEWHATGRGVSVRTDRATYEADDLVIAAGAWADALLPDEVGLVTPERQVLAWFEPRRPELFTPARMPMLVAEFDEGHYYTAPIHGIPGLKVGRYHHLGERVEIESLDRDAGARDEAALRPFVERYLPEAAGPVIATAVCTFPISRDGHFIIDRYSAHPGVTLAIGFGGNGYKFATAAGEAVAALVMGKRPAIDLTLFRFGRLAAA